MDRVSNNIPEQLSNRNWMNLAEIDRFVLASISVLADNICCVPAANMGS